MSLFQIRRYLSAGLLLVNPLCGMLMVASVLELSWYWNLLVIPALILVVVGVLRFYFWSWRIKHLRYQVIRKWACELAGWTYIRTAGEDDDQVYRHNRTGMYRCGFINKEGNLEFYGREWS